MPDLDPEIRGEAGGGNPDAEIRGLPGLQFFVFLFCFVLFFFLKPFAPQFGHGLLVWSRNKGGEGAGPQRPSSGSTTANN